MDFELGLNRLSVKRVFMTLVTPEMGLELIHLLNCVT